MVESITLMMVTYNRLELTKRTINNLFKVTNVPFNFVIVDNGSEDGTVDYLTDILPSAKSNNNVDIYISPFSENKGIAIGRNKALKLADDLKTDWYCTIDNDVEVPDGWLTSCIDILRAVPKYGMVGVNMEGKPYPEVTEKGHTFQNKPQGNLGTACMVFPKNVHKMLGFFSTEYGKYGEEDADLGLRARVVGYKLGYIKEMGNHFGVGDLDAGEYREWKTACHNKNLTKFNANCRAYYNKQKPIYIPFK